MNETVGRANLEEAETDDQLAMMKTWNLAVDLMTRAFALCITRTRDEYGVATPYEAGALQGIKDTCRKVLLTMGQAKPFSNLYPEAIAAATFVDDSWMEELQARSDEMLKSIVKPGSLREPRWGSRLPGKEGRIIR